VDIGKREKMKIVSTTWNKSKDKKRRRGKNTGEETLCLEEINKLIRRKKQ
jgi:hypothetical protein